MPDDPVAQINAFARDRHPGLVGATVLTLEKDRVTGRLDVTRELVAGTGFLWAPVIITLADWLCAAAMGPNLPEDASFTTVELKANFVGTVREGGAIRAEATPVHRGRTTQVWDVRVADESDDRTVAVFRCTQMVLHGFRERA